MPDLQKLAQQKERILSTIRLRGPSLPVQIAKAVETPPMFAAAFLSELLADKRLKISNMKVGSSPLYFLEGQESLLENFTEHLNSREKEALIKLKQEQILEDEKLEPVTRVALRAIKDFAKPIRVLIQGETKLFWRYFQLPEQDTKDKIHNLIRPPTLKPKPQKLQPKISPPKEKIEKKAVTIKPQILDTKASTITQPQTTQTSEKKPSDKDKSSILPIQAQLIKPKKTIDSKFTKNVKSLLTVKDIELLEEIFQKKKEFTAKVRTNSQFGKQSFLLIAKEKKKVTENDFILAVQKAYQEKMPALFISSGTPDKKALTLLEEWKNLIKFENI